MATEVTKIVDPGEGAGHDYHSLSLWEAGEQGDLTGVRDEIAIAKCRATGGTADTTLLVINGWTTSATQYIKIWTDTSESYRHSGKWDTTKYRLDVANATAIEDYALYLRIDGIQIRQNAANDNYQYGIITYFGSSVTADVRLSNSIIWRNVSDNTYTGLPANFNCNSSTSYYVYIWNCVFKNDCITGVSGNNANVVFYNVNHAYIYSSTMWGGYIGLRSADTSVVISKNNIVTDTNGVDFYTSGGGSLTNTNCASKDATADDYGGSGNHPSHTFTFVSVANCDFHLGSADTGAIDLGTDTSGEGAPLNFTTDIDGVARGATWDIGADEYVAAGGSLDISTKVTALCG